jgi:hypothetical protein
MKCAGSYFGDDNVWEDNVGFGVFGVFQRAREDPLETIFGELRVHWLLGIFTAVERFH